MNHRRFRPLLPPDVISRRCKRIFQEVSVPQFEYQQLPDNCRVIAVTVLVLAEQPFYRAAPEISALQGTFLQQQRNNFCFHLGAHPVDERQRKALFMPVEYAARHP